MTSKGTLAVLACGTMGTAILSGVLESQRAIKEGAHVPVEGESGHTVLPERYIVTVGRPASAKRLKSTFESEGYSHVEVHTQENVVAAREADCVLLCCKPQRVGEFLGEEGMRDALKNKIVVSIAAGVTISKLQKYLDASTKVVRAMPNTPSKIREGMTVISNVDSLSQDERDLLCSIFSAVGRCHFLDEKFFDAATALAGSGPAFVTLFLEAMTDGGVMMGLPRAEALELAAQSMYYGTDPQLCKELLVWCYSRVRTQLRSRTASRHRVAARSPASCRWKMVACARPWLARSKRLLSMRQDWAKTSGYGTM